MIHLGHLALSGAGLLIVEATAVSPEGRISPRILGCIPMTNEQAHGAGAGGDPGVFADPHARCSLAMPGARLPASPLGGRRADPPGCAERLADRRAFRRAARDGEVPPRGTRQGGVGEGAGGFRRGGQACGAAGV